MNMRYLKHILITMGLLVSLIFALNLTINHEIENDAFYAELLYYVEDEVQAFDIESTYQVELINLSPHGIATFGITQRDIYQEMEGQGFIPNSIYEANEITSEVLGGHTPSVIYQYALSMMNIEQAWLFTEGSSDVTIAIIDTGVDITHEEFIGRLSPISYNSRTEQVGLSYVIDTAGHGTSVAGVIGALNDNNKGISGIVQNSILMIIKANNEDDLSTIDKDESKFFSDAAIIEGIYYAVDHGADVINMSFGSSSANSLTETAIEYAISNDVILVAASGNDASDELVYPASFEGVISVSAVDETTQIWEEYYDGVLKGSNYGSQIDIAAPGDLIATASIGDTYGYSTGTSLAAPQVTGVVALLISQYPNETSNQIIERILQGAVDYGDAGRDDYYGYGIINAEQAMNVVQYLVIVQFETDGGDLIDPIEVYSGHTIDIVSPTKIGHTFSGWYKDALFQIPFVMGVDLITDNTILYALFTPIMYTVEFVTDGNDCSNIEVAYGQTFELPITQIVGYTFVGWYIDSAHTTLYNGDPITGDITLFAFFEILLHQVTAYVNEEIYLTLDVQDGNTFEISEPHLENQRFLGWYQDIEYLIPYEFSELYHDLNLYAKFDDQQFQVLFYASDLISIYQESYVYLGDSATVPTAPIKPSTPSFDFIFVEWSETSDLVTHELDIYPIYEKIYKPESIDLIPGVDTIIEGQDWNDQGTSLIDDLLHIVIRSALDNETPGTHTLYYDIYDGLTLIDTRVRVIHVIPLKTEIKITLNPDITTIFEGDVYEDSGAVTNLGEIVSSGSVDSETEGIYVITYTVFYDNQIVTKNKYVYVLPNSMNPNTTSIYYIKEEDGIQL